MQDAVDQSPEHTLDEAQANLESAMSQIDEVYREHVPSELIRVHGEPERLACARPARTGKFVAAQHGAPMPLPREAVDRIIEIAVDHGFTRSDEVPFADERVFMKIYNERGGFILISSITEAEDRTPNSSFGGESECAPGYENPSGRPHPDEYRDGTR